MRGWTGRLAATAMVGLLAVIGVAAPAQAAGPTAALTAMTEMVAAGGQPQVKWTLTGLPSGSRAILQWRAPGSSTWTKAKDFGTVSRGTAVIPAMKTIGTWKLRVVGLQAGRTLAQSPAVSIRVVVVPKASITATARIDSGKAPTVTWTVAHLPPGANVQIQRRTTGAWTTIRSTTAASGSFDAAPVTGPNLVQYRAVVVVGTKTFAASTPSGVKVYGNVTLTALCAAVGQLCRPDWMTKAELKPFEVAMERERYGPDMTTVLDFDVATSCRSVALTWTGVSDANRLEVKTVGGLKWVSVSGPDELVNVTFRLDGHPWSLALGVDFPAMEAKARGTASCYTATGIKP